MSKEKELQAETLDQEALDQAAGGVQAGKLYKTEWSDEFGNHYRQDSTGKVHVYRPDGTEINPPAQPQKKTWL